MFMYQHRETKPYELLYNMTQGYRNRLRKCFNELGINEMADLTCLCEDDLMKVPNVGLKAVDLLKDEMKKKGYKLKEDKKDV